MIFQWIGEGASLFTTAHQSARAQSPSLTNRLFQSVEKSSESLQDPQFNSAFDLSGISIGAGFLIPSETISAYVGYRFNKTHQLSVEHHTLSQDDYYCDGYGCYDETYHRESWALI